MSVADDGGGDGLRKGSAHPTVLADYPNGWFAKSLAIGRLAQAVLERKTPPFPPAKTVTARG